MKPTKHQPNQATPGFAILISNETDLGTGLLIAEDDDGGYLPISPVSTISEAREIAQHDMRQRMRQVERGGSPFCPAIYKVWARGTDGFAVAAEFEASSL
jgi:hypothetical protein